MILPTMNDDERAYEAFRMTTWLCDCYDKSKDEINDRFRRGTRFPYIQRMLCEDDKNNKWWFAFLCPSKDFKKRGIYLTLCYTIYDIPPQRRVRDTNSGKGVLMFDPLAIRKKLNGIDTRGAIIVDISPHAINRYTERFLKPNGKGDIEINRKVESIIIRWQHFDVSADIYGDKNAQKHKDDGLCPYDVIMRGGGILRGYLVNDIFVKINTYVSEDMMFDNQKEWYDNQVSEHFRWRRKGIIP